MNQRQEPRLSGLKWGLAGSLGGMMGWYFGLLVVVLVGGRLTANLDVVLPAFFMALGIAGAAIIPVLMTLPERRRFGLALAGSLTWHMGLVLFLWDTWIMPELERDPAVVKFMKGIGAASRFSSLLFWLLMGGGSILLAVFVYLTYVDLKGKVGS